MRATLGNQNNSVFHRATDRVGLLSEFLHVQNRCNAYIVQSTKFFLENGVTTVNYVLREPLQTSNRKFGGVLLNVELAVMQNLS